MTFDWRTVATLAGELATRDDEASSRSAISRAYYSLYCIARDRARLNTEGLRDSHKTVFEFYARRDSAMLRMFGTNYLPALFRDRKEADYREDVQVTKIKASLVVKKAKKLLEQLDGISDAEIAKVKR